MKLKHFSLLFALTMVAAMLAVSVAIFLTSITNRPTPLRSADPIIPTPTVSVWEIEGVWIRLEPSQSRRVEFVNIPVAAAPEAAVAADDAPPPPEPIPTPIVVTPEPTRDLRPVIFIEYVVLPGDNLYAIADRQNSSIELMALHDISDIDMVPGKRIERLPIANPAYCPNRRAYVVRDKDTAYRIAVQFGTTAQVLREINNLNADYRVDVTQVICVP
jgi:hypothetical protein